MYSALNFASQTYKYLLKKTRGGIRSDVSRYLPVQVCVLVQNGTKAVRRICLPIKRLRKNLQVKTT